MSALSVLAASLGAGQWANLTTIGMDAAFATTGDELVTNPYASVVRWDSSRKRLYFFGSDHDTAAGTGPHHVVYDDATNTWSNYGIPTWAIVQPGPVYADAHGYCLTATSANSRKMYRSPYSQHDKIRTWDMDANDTGDSHWDVFTAGTPAFSGGTNALEYFPERNSLIHLRADTSTVDEYSITGSSWATNLFSNIGLNTTWTFLQYSPVDKLVLMGSWPTGLLVKISQTLTFTIQGTIPYSFYDGSGSGGLWTVCPVSGTFFLIRDLAAGRTMYEYNVNTDSYTLSTHQPIFNPISGSYSNVQACPIPEYGVILFVWTGGGSGGGPVTGASVYKHAASSTPSTRPVLVMH